MVYSFIYLLYTQTHGHVCIMWICGTLSLCGIPRRDLSQFSLGYFAMSLDFTAWVRQRSQGLHNASGWTSLTAWHPCFCAGPPEIRTLQDSFRILQHSAAVLELVQATGKATLPRSRRPSFSFMKSQGCKIQELQELQTGTCLRSQVLLWQWRFMLVSRLSDLHMEVLACLVLLQLFWACL